MIPRTNSTASARVPGARSSATVYGPVSSEAAGDDGPGPGSPAVVLPPPDGFGAPDPSSVPVHPTSSNVPATAATTGLCATMLRPRSPTAGLLASSVTHGEATG